VQQQAGAEFAAWDVKVQLGGEVSSIGMDIAGAYPETAGLSFYRRAVRLIKGEGVEIIDSYSGDLQAELSLMTSEQPAVFDGRIGVGDRGQIILSGGGQLRVEEIAISDPRLRQAWPERIFRILAPIEGRELRLWIG
jgi:hypothetical protein